MTEYNPQAPLWKWRTISSLIYLGAGCATSTGRQYRYPCPHHV